MLSVISVQQLKKKKPHQNWRYLFAPDNGKQDFTYTE